MNSTVKGLSPALTGREWPSATIPYSQVRLMKQARESATFNFADLGAIIYGSEELRDETVEALQRVEKALGGDDTFKLPVVYQGLNREQMLLEGFRAGKITFQDGLRYKHSVFDTKTHDFSLGNANPFGMTKCFFVPFLKLVGSNEQIAHWLPLAESGQITGSYVQTELSHGTHVGGIETTATFDYDRDEFLLHSPTLTSAKYWPGSLGFGASHIILMARLLVGTEDYGIHPFMVQLRSLDNFEPLPGVELGDIGLKPSYNSIDNGYAIFNNARIPRSSLLCRHASVSRSGIYTTDPLRKKLLYSGMLSGRAIIIRNVAFQLAKALTIATRYSVVREQGRFLGPEERLETPIIAYKHQHYRLLTNISHAYVILLAWMRANAAYEDLLTLQRAGDHSALPFMHILMCGLKAWSTQTATDGAEEARKMCGGHGYLAMSGLPDIVASLSATCTFEGENWVLWGQVAKYLMKSMDAAVLPIEMAYVDSHCQTKEARCAAQGQDFANLEVLADIFKYRAAKLIREAHAKIIHEVIKGAHREHAKQKLALDLNVAARAHIEVFVVDACIQKVFLLGNSVSAEAKNVLHRMAIIFALTTITSPIAPFTSSFIQGGYLGQSQMDDMNDLIDTLLAELLPDAIALTDAFCFTDLCLKSAIGCKDGDIYRRLMVWTRQLPINVEATKSLGVFENGWEQFIKPFLRENERMASIASRAKL